METTTDPGQKLLDEIASLDVQRARIEASIASRMVEFADLRRRESERQADPMLRDLEADFATDELSLVVKEPTRTVQCRLADARRVRGRLPLTWEAFVAGRILDVTEIGRVPSRRLRIAIDIRDGTCRFATCSRPASECDDDHAIPHPRGPTSGANLRSLCRRHHRMKPHLGVEPTELQVRRVDEQLAPQLA